MIQQNVVGMRPGIVRLAPLSFSIRTPSETSAFGIDLPLAPFRVLGIHAAQLLQQMILGRGWLVQR